MTVELNVVGAETSEYFDEEKTLFEGDEQECFDFAANWIYENERYLMEIDGYLTIDGSPIRYEWDGDMVRTFY